MLDCVFEVGGVVEFALELLAPLGHQSQDLRVLDFDVVGGDVFL